MNNLIAKSVRATYDVQLTTYMQEEIEKILENDQICFIEPESPVYDEYKVNLRKTQLDFTDKIFGFMQSEFEIKLDVFEGIPSSVPDKSVKKVKNVTAALDPMALTCLFQMSQSTRSSAVGLCILHDKISIEEGVRAARADEDFQTAKFGVVQGAHDLDEAYLYTTLSSAKNVINLA